MAPVGLVPTWLRAELLPYYSLYSALSTVTLGFCHFSSSAGNRSLTGKQVDAWKSRCLPFIWGSPHPGPQENTPQQGGQSPLHLPPSGAPRSWSDLPSQNPVLLSASEGGAPLGSGPPVSLPDAILAEAPLPPGPGVGGAQGLLGALPPGPMAACSGRAGAQSSPGACRPPLEPGQGPSGPPSAASRCPSFRALPRPCPSSLCVGRGLTPDGRH